MNHPVIRCRDLQKTYPSPAGFPAGIKTLISGHPDLEGTPALRGIDLDLAAGETVGLIGPNGSGKTTLLRILAGITRPTSGTCELPGQIASLIELGAGFAPGLNAFANIRREAALTGLSVKWADQNMGRILEFAGLPDETLRRPLGTFSAGERIRLGFALAITRPADLLVIDEVLAVGDERFQQKCLEAFREIRKTGRQAVVLASHALGQVRAVCDRAVWLDSGTVRAIGPAWQVTEDYRRSQTEQHPPSGAQVTERGDFFIESVDVCPPVPSYGSPFEIRVTYRALKSIEHPNLGIAIHRTDGVLCYGTSSVKAGVRKPSVNGPGLATVRLRNPSLLPGNYQITAGLFDADDVVKYDYHDRRYPFRIAGETREDGVCRIPFEFEWE